MSIKFTNEPPAGIKAGLKRTYQNITQDLLDISNLSAWKPMLYCVSYLHTVVQVSASDAAASHIRCPALYSGRSIGLKHCMSIG